MPHSEPWSRILPRLAILVTVVAIIAATLSLLSLVHYYDSEPRKLWSERISISVDDVGPSAIPEGLSQTEVKNEGARKWDTDLFVVGNATARFRENLRDDTTYITAWCMAGFTNEFIGYINLIYLSILAERVPVVPPFAPEHHISKEAGVIPFGDIFNLTLLRSTLQMPILEWSDIKALPPSTYPEAYSQTSIEQLGCWSTRPEDTNEPNRAHNLMNHLGLDASYTRVPGRTRLNPNQRNDNHIVFSQLSAMLHEGGSSLRPGNRDLMAESLLGARLEPDETLACLDTLYYMTSGAEVYEWRFPWSPAWRFVGRHARFNQYLVDRAEGYLKRAFRLEDHVESIPKFISVHIRHGDFHDNCSIEGHCLSSVTPFSNAVAQIQASLEKKNIVTTHVLVSSDETDTKFWEEITSLGWYYIDHEAEGTLGRFGEWHAPLVDIVVQSLATGFVGTADSTFSLVSGRRVEDWNGGYYTLVAGR